jgi:hypothetical protein
MPLNVTVYTELQLIDEAPNAQLVSAKYYDDEARALQVEGDQLVYIDPDTAGIFAERLPPLALGGVYRVAGTTKTHSVGSSEDYDEWREWLCRLMLAVRCEILFEKPARYAGNPFTRLIDFSDSEGWIGYADCIVLAAAFKARLESARRSANVTQRPHLFDIYQQFAAAFALAAESGGAVQFH